MQVKIPETSDTMHDAPPQSAITDEPASQPAVGRVTPPAEAVAPWWHTALFIVLLFGGSFLNARQARHAGLGGHHLGRYIAGIGAEALLVAFTWWGLRMKRVRLTSLLGFRGGWRGFADDCGAAAVFWVMALAILAVTGVMLRLAHLGAPQKAIAQLAPQSALQMLLWIALSASAGFAEEIAFRGYFLRQFASPVHRLWLGVLGSSLIFGCSHAYEGAAGMIAITVYGALFCLLAIARNSLRPGMIAHAWHDIFSGAMLALAHHFHLV